MSEVTVVKEGWLHKRGEWGLGLGFERKSGDWDLGDLGGKWGFGICGGNGGFGREMGDWDWDLGAQNGNGGGLGQLGVSM